MALGNLQHSGVDLSVNILVISVCVRGTSLPISLVGVVGGKKNFDFFSDQSSCQSRQFWALVITLLSNHNHTYFISFPFMPRRHNDMFYCTHK